MLTGESKKKTKELPVMEKEIRNRWSVNKYDCKECSLKLYNDYEYCILFFPTTVDGAPDSHGNYERPRNPL